LAVLFELRRICPEYLSVTSFDGVVPMRCVPAFHREWQR
jgi:hypothetical protein